MTATAFATIQRGTSAALRYGEHRLEVQAHVPARVVTAGAGDARLGRALLQHRELVECFREVAFGSDDAYERLHRVLQVAVDLVRILAFDPLKRSERVAHDLRELSLVELRLAADALSVLRGVL